MDNILSSKEVAQILNIAPGSVSRLLKQGKLEGKKMGSAWAVSAESVSAYKEAIEGKSKHDPTRGQSQQPTDQ